MHTRDIPMTVDTFETRGPEPRPKVLTLLKRGDQTQDPKVTTVLHFATRPRGSLSLLILLSLRREDQSHVQKSRQFFISQPGPPPIPATIDTCETRRPSKSKSDNSPALRDQEPPNPWEC